MTNSKTHATNPPIVRVVSRVEQRVVVVGVCVCVCVCVCVWRADPTHHCKSSKESEVEQGVVAGWRAGPSSGVCLRKMDRGKLVVIRAPSPLLMAKEVMEGIAGGRV
ncbi:hypothetical protein Pmani_031718 [Petrolisthes manimaculis]|uniref:Uncharacterized protein n=1 Tax=Petrolisthes manimaculis TaxID=1843537 RepID=A0AAE1NT65_9EUCA|nr:hypothetical protein Pmani_031718 [Petrolisthes manimaculis]